MRIRRMLRGVKGFLMLRVREESKREGCDHDGVIDVALLDSLWDLGEREEDHLNVFSLIEIGFF